MPAPVVLDIWYALWLSMSFGSAIQSSSGHNLVSSLMTQPGICISCILSNCRQLSLVDYANPIISVHAVKACARPLTSRQVRVSGPTISAQKLEQRKLDGYHKIKTLSAQDSCWQVSRERKL